MAQPLVELGIAARLAAAATLRRWRGGLEPEPDRHAFRRDFEALLEAAPDGLIRETAWLDMPADEPPWVGSGLQLEPGESATWFACGRVYVARALDIWAPPSLQLWARVGEQGRVFSGTRDHHTFSAAAGGELSFGNYFPNDWATRDGETLRGSDVYAGAAGGMTILAIVWRGEASKGLRAIADTAGPGVARAALSSERERLRQGRTAPEGWHYLWHLGEAEIFRPREGVTPTGGPAVTCHTHRDVGILQHDVDFALTPETRIAWQWKVDELPSRLREDTTPTHDYLSLAVEFDDGLDLSYYWSATLAPETFYACPLDNWKDKETHLVVRSGHEGLSRWQREDRNLYADYRRAIHERATRAHADAAMPARVVRVWFIAVSLFQRNTGRCEYAGIRLSNGDETIAVL